MLNRLHIEGFKSIRSATVDLGTVNVFIGANGSGKSNVLEALGVLGATLFGAVDAEPLKYRGVRPGLPTLYKTSFRGAAIPRIIKLHAASVAAEYRVGLENPLDKPERRWKIQSESLSESEAQILGRSLNGCVVFSKSGKTTITPDRTESAVKTALQQQTPNDARSARDLVSRITDYGIYAPSTSILRGLGQDVAKPPLGLSGSGLAIAVRDLLPLWRKPDSVFDLDSILELIDWAESLSIVAPEQATISPAVNVGRAVLRFTDRYMASSRKTLSAYDASEGALYVLFLVALASHPDSPPLFAVDNFDHALHPRLASRLMTLVSDGLSQMETRQMLLTTHNPLVLDGLDLRDDRVRLFAVERARARENDAAGRRLVEGETLVRRIILTPQLLDQIQQGWSLSRLWVMGRIGGIPEGI